MRADDLFLDPANRQNEAAQADLARLAVSTFYRSL